MRNFKGAVLGLSLAVMACGVDSEVSVEGSDVTESFGAEEATAGQAISCAPRMSLFPIRGAHNIGYDASCAHGCPVSCPDQRANSDWSAARGHNGIDVFAHYRAELQAVADGKVVAVGRPAPNAGLRVRVRDACGWEYFYGHMDQIVVTLGQQVSAGQLLGYMGHTGTSSDHLHFNVSTGNYYQDINPFNLLASTSATACAATAPPPVPTPAPAPAPAPANCGSLSPGEGLAAGQAVSSCDGRFVLAMQTDGNLVLYMGGTPLWHTFTNGKGGAALWMQGDGNLVLYTANGIPLWHSHTNGYGGAFLAIQNDGNLVVYQGGVARWNSGTSGH